MSTPYSHVHFPPAPVLKIALALPDQPPLYNFAYALVDTGADGTFVPLDHLIALNARAEYQVRVRGHLSGSRIADVYAVDIVIDALRLPAIDVIADPENQEVILGRNVLNKLLLLMDGPHAVLDLLEYGQNV
jgi:predicted aspartyl protease